MLYGMQYSNVRDEIVDHFDGGTEASARVHAVWRAVELGPVLCIHQVRSRASH